jgi:two-component system, OmpR family, alkaline phosphatase synthesis response regulator PhoP
MLRILLVEDEESLRKVISMNLTLEGYEVVAVDDGRRAADIVDEQHFDLLLLDIMLPHVNGLDIARKVRLQNSKVGIIFISAKDSSEDRIQGLKVGADDYLIKPFSLEELLLRVQAVIKRTIADSPEAHVNETYDFGGFHINFIEYIVTRADGTTFELTKKEALLLKLLIDCRGEVVSRQKILQTIWGYDVYPSTRTIDNFILNYRKFFEIDPKNPAYFHSIRGVGYKFISDGK